jgi:hypothetical protein
MGSQGNKIVEGKLFLYSIFQPIKKEGMAELDHHYF